jgi:BMFP domain-containing protein YqiC
MVNKNFLDDISDKVASLLPKAEALGSEMKGELNAKIQSAIKSSLESLDVVRIWRSAWRRSLKKGSKDKGV